MAIANGDSAPQFTGSFMILLRQPLDGITQVNFEFPLQVDIGVLRRACANREEEGGPLDAQGAVITAGSPPQLVLLQKGRRIYEIVVEIGIVEEVLNKDVCSRVRGGSSTGGCNGVLTGVRPRGDNLQSPLQLRKDLWVLEELSG